MAADQGGKRDPKLVTVLAGQLRARILSGELKDGDELPSEAELVEEFGVSKVTARGAVEILAGEALVNKRQGRPSVVTYRDPVHRLLLVPGGMLDQRTKESPAIFTQDPRATAGRRVCHERPVGVPERFAGLLGLESGRVMMERTIRLEVDDETVLTSISYVPIELAEGDGLEWCDVEVGQLALVGYPMTVEPGRVQARPPSPTEREALGMHRGPSLTILGNRYQVQVGERPVSAGVIVLARGDRVFLEPDADQEH